jgi:hypothetical protein
MSPTRPPQDVAVLFFWLGAMAVVWNYTTSSNLVWWYWLHFDPVHTPAIALGLLSAFVLACYPGSRTVLAVFAGVQTTVLALRMPYLPTHEVMELVLFATLFAAAAVRFRHDVDADGAATLFGMVAPVGRSLLVAMYFFGTVHKLNTSFLDPETSCAIPIAAGVPLLGHFMEYDWGRYAAIYGTLILEAVAALFLLERRTKYWGMAIGIPFHIAIGISSYGAIAHFSALAVALHALFLPADFAARSAASLRDLGLAVTARHAQWLAILLTALLIWCALGAHWRLTNVVFGCYAIAFYVLVLRHGREQAARNPAYLTRPLWLNAFPLLFWLHCCGPYLGLSTAGVTEMFSGLRVEGHLSNHLLVRRPLYLGDYHARVAEVVHSHDEYLASLAADDLGILVFDLQRYLVQKPEPLIVPLTLAIDGERVRIVDGPSLASFAGTWFTPQSWWERKLLAFDEVEPQPAPGCRH